MLPLRAVHGDTALEEIVVTAEKRAASAQTVPIALTALSADQIARNGATGLEHLQGLVPSMQFASQSADAVRVQMTIRGIGSDVIESGADAGVGLYLDGVYMGRTSAALTTVFDVERVEVLRGPQGTLYGRNTSGGAVNVIGKRPTREFEAFGQISAGNYQSWAARGLVNGSLTSNLSARLSFGGVHRTGFQTNSGPGGTTADDDKSGFARLQLLYQPSEGFNFLGSAFYDKIGGVGPATRSFGPTPPVFAVGVLPNGIPNLSGIFNPSTYSLARPFPLDYHTVFKNTPESVSVPMYGLTGTLDWTRNSFYVKSVTSYQSSTQDEVRDIDSTELPLLSLTRHETGDQITQEINIGSGTSRRFEWLAGVFYFREKVDTRLQILGQGGYVGFGGPGGGLDQTVIGQVTTTSYALFGQSSINVSDRLKLTAGLRYTDDRRSMQSSAGFIDRVNGAVLLAGGSTVRPSIDITDSWKRPTWKGGVDYQLTDDMLAYVSVSNAFKSGGFNLGNPLAGAFNPERMTAYELGIKSYVLDHHLKVNAAAFHYDVKDMQLQVFGIGGPTIVNATGGKADGVELETTAALPKGLRVLANASWLRTRFDDGFFEVDPAQLSFLGPNPPMQNLSGNHFPRAPQFSFTLSPEYTARVGRGEFSLGIRYSYQTTTYFRAFNDQTPYRFQPAFGVLNLRVGYEWQDSAWRATFYADNLADKQYLTNDFVPPILLGSPDIATTGAPRTWRLQIDHGFR